MGKRYAALAALFVLVNGHVFLMAWLAIESGVPWERYWEFFFSPYALVHTTLATALWLFVAWPVLFRRRNALT